jgi:hypothetical protein
MPSVRVPRYRAAINSSLRFQVPYSHYYSPKLTKQKGEKLIKKMTVLDTFSK